MSKGRLKAVMAIAKGKMPKAKPVEKPVVSPRKGEVVGGVWFANDCLNSVKAQKAKAETMARAIRAAEILAAACSQGMESCQGSNEKRGMASTCSKAATLECIPVSSSCNVGVFSPRQVQERTTAFGQWLGRKAPARNRIAQVELPVVNTVAKSHNSVGVCSNLNGESLVLVCGK